MAKLLPPYLAWRDGRPRWIPGPGIRPTFSGRDLKDASGHWLGLEAAIAAARDLNAEVAAWRAGGSPRRRPRAARRPARTARALFDAWIETPEFKALAPATRSDYRRKAGIWLADFGDVPVAAIGRAALKGYWRTAYDARGHAMANGILAVARALLTFATDEEWIEVNPALALNLLSVEPRVAFWAATKVAALVATADAIGEEAIGDAVVIALHSAQRQGDILAMPARIFAERLRLTQFKTAALIDAPMTPALVARIAAIRERWRAAGVVARETIVADARGRPYKSDHFRHVFAAVRAAAAAAHPELAAAERMQPGLADLRFQDLRDTAVTRLAMAGCTLPQIAAISGHAPDHITSVIKHYLALNEAIADAAIELLSSWLDREGIAI